MSLASQIQKFTPSAQARDAVSQKIEQIVLMIKHSSNMHAAIGTMFFNRLRNIGFDANFEQEFGVKSPVVATVFNNDKVNIHALIVFRELLQDGIISDEELEGFKVVYHAIKDKREEILEDIRLSSWKFFLSKGWALTTTPPPPPPPTVISELSENLPALKRAALDLSGMIQEDNNIAVFIGNTPQLVRYIFKQLAPQFNTTSIGLSGHPDNPKYPYLDSLLESIVTSKGAANYNEYLIKMGLTRELCRVSTIYFIDDISTGGALDYLMKAIAHIAFEDNCAEAIKHIKLVSLNGFHRCKLEWVTEAMQFDLASTNLAHFLDQASDTGPDRLMPNASSYRWDDDEYMLYLEERSKGIFEDPNPVFDHVFNQIDLSLQPVDVLGDNS